MFWPDTQTGVDVEPERKVVQSAVRKFFTEGGVGVPPTVPGGDWFNQITNELLNVLAAANIDPSKADDDQLLAAIKFVSNSTSAYEAIRRSYSEAGFTLRPKPESFKNGGTLTSATDVLLDHETGKAYSGAGPFPQDVLAGTNPTSGGYLNRSNELLRGWVADIGSDVGMLKNDVGRLNTLQQTYPPSVPAITNGNKFFISWGEANVRGYIVSKLHNGRYVAVALTDEVAPSDAVNLGGLSNIRPGKALQCISLKLAKTRAHAKTAGVIVSSLTPLQIKTVWGYYQTELFQVVANAVTDFSWQNPNVYVLPYSSGGTESVEYMVNAGKSAKIIFGVTPGSSKSVLVETSVDGGLTYIPYATVNTGGGVAGEVFRKEFDVSTGFANPWFIRITNKTADLGSPAYVAGLNIMDLPDDGLHDFDSVLLQIAGTSSMDLSYQMVNGANEFAAIESSSGKWFGTYHGGHSEFIERLRFDSGMSIDIRDPLPSFAYISKSFELYSQSKITAPNGVTANYSAVTQFGDGCHITTYSIKPSAPVRCVRVYTHMCTTAPSFERVVLPEYLIKTDDGLVRLGNVQHCKQDRAFDPASLRAWWSGLPSINNIDEGLVVSFLPNYNKQYYGPIVDIPGDFDGGMFVTAKEYL